MGSTSEMTADGSSEEVYVNADRRVETIVPHCSVTSTESPVACAGAATTSLSGERSLTIFADVPPNNTPHELRMFEPLTETSVEPCVEPNAGETEVIWGVAAV